MIRTLGSFICAALTTSALLFLMMAAINDPAPAQPSRIQGAVLDFVRLVEDKPIEIKDPKPKQPPEVPEEPEFAPPTTPFDGDDWGLPPNDEPAADEPTLLLAFLDGDYLPIVKIEPEYPARAIARQLEGYVLVEFTVTPTGRVVDPVIVSAEPIGVFEQASTNAVLKFRYKPRVVDGSPTAVPGVRNLFRFKLAGRG